MPRNLTIRPFKPEDIPVLEGILHRNSQLWHPEVEGGAAMLRFAAHQGAVFLVAEATIPTEPAPRPIGLGRGVYDGSRAVVHLLSVDPEWQRCGVGTALLRALRQGLQSLGAPTVSATVGAASVGFWEKQGFKDTGVNVYLREE